MMNTVYGILGFGGAVLSLLAYLQVSRGKWHGKSYRFQVSNLLAGAFLIVYGWHTRAYANILLNSVWLIIAIVALGRIRSRTRTKT
jgi:hypothetical protein